LAGAAAAGTGNSDCAESAAQASRLIVGQARTDFLNQFFNFVDLLQSGKGQHVGVVLFQGVLHVVGELNELRGVFQVLLVLLLQDGIALGFAVGKFGVGIVLIGGGRKRLPVGGKLRRGQAGGGGQGQQNEAAMKPELPGRKPTIS